MLLQIFHMFAHLCFRFSFQRSFLSQRSNVSIAIHQEIGHWLSISIAIWNTLVHIDMRLWIVQIWHYFVTFDCVHRRRYSSGNCARLTGGPRVLWSLSTCVCYFVAMVTFDCVSATLVRFNRLRHPRDHQTRYQQAAGTLMEIYVANLWQANCCFFCPILFTGLVIWLGNH